MIEIKHAVKSFDQVEAIRDLSLTIRDGEVFGLVGTNGAGKSTLLRMVAGIIRPDKGEILSDGSVIYENEELKKEIFYISDEGYVFPNSVPLEMMRFYMSVYPSFQEKRFHELMSRFGLDEKRKISTFSKGMKKQAAIALVLASMPEYLLLDEPIDGRDVIVVEDIIDSGHTLSYLLQNLTSRHPASLRLCTLLDKPSRRAPEIDIHVDYTGFEVPDQFVVGWGMDYDQRYRNLPYIGVITGLEE